MSNVLDFVFEDPFFLMIIPCWMLITTISETIVLQHYTKRLKNGQHTRQDIST